ncbi:MAG TPA: FAD-binding oxidoreductase, partial [Bacteroidales bacterium]|nr:FAD-binding oxidoreductase [Bacteroidales bacterium]
MDKAAADPVEAIRALEALAAEFEGEIFTDYDYRLLYATDASAYREVPLAIARPRHKEDILRLIRLASEHRIGLIPRTAGTSLAGQVVGGGIMVDVSRYMTRVLEVNAAEHWVRVEPGVILDELNKLLQPLGLFFGPETSTSNRCMIGGMVGNNSCGAHSLVYGSTRDHTLEITALLSDGSEVRFADLNPEALGQKCRQDDLEGKVYKTLFNILNDKDIQKSIREEYPDPSIHRRNTGYALDLLLDCAPFTPGGPPFNLCRLLAGSEGTLAIT